MDIWGSWMGSLTFFCWKTPFAQSLDHWPLITWKYRNRLGFMKVVPPFFCIFLGQFCTFDSDDLSKNCGTICASEEVVCCVWAEEEKRTPPQWGEFSSVRTGFALNPLSPSPHFSKSKLSKWGYAGGTSPVLTTMRMQIQTETEKLAEDRFHSDKFSKLKGFLNAMIYSTADS